MRFYLQFLLFTMCGSLSLSAQLNRKREVSNSFYANGALAKTVIVKTSTTRNIDPYNYYKKTRATIITFDSITGMQQERIYRVTKLGRDGKHCYELYACTTTYDQQGRKRRVEIRKCDKSYTKTEDYQDGKLVFVRIFKTRKR
jgi:hypothetical protein